MILLVLSLTAIASPSGAEEFQYDPHGKRDPMVPLIGQEKSLGGAVAFGEIASPEDVRLEGIAGTMSGRRTAIINGELVKEGFKLGEVEVSKITKKSVLIKIGGKEYNIDLPEEGDQKK